MLFKGWGKWGVTALKKKKRQKWEKGHGVLEIIQKGALPYKKFGGKMEFKACNAKQSGDLSNAIAVLH